MVDKRDRMNDTLTSVPFLPHYESGIETEAIFYYHGFSIGCFSLAKKIGHGHHNSLEFQYDNNQYSIICTVILCLRRIGCWYPTPHEAAAGGTSATTLLPMISRVVGCWHCCCCCLPYFCVCLNESFVSRFKSQIFATPYVLKSWKYLVAAACCFRQYSLRKTSLLTSLPR